MKLKDVFFSWDFLAAANIAGFLLFFLPHSIPSAFAKDVYAIGIAVLSITFSVFFAALAIIITSGDDDFIAFLQTNHTFTLILAFFKFTLGLLFVALMASIVLYGGAALSTAANNPDHHKFFMSLFALLFFWSIFAAYVSTGDAIKYAERRVAYLAARQGQLPPSP
jgi:hypothetical protein